MKTILFPTDFSDNSFNALGYAAAIAKKSGARLLLLHTYQVMATVDPDMPQSIMDKIRKETEDAAKDKLSHLAADIKSGKFSGSGAGPECESICRFGFTVDEITAVAGEQQADLIVMGTHGAGGMKKVLFGSNTASVIGKTVCPVLAVPPDASFKPIHKAAFATDLKPGNLHLVQKDLELFTLFGSELLFVFVDEEHIFATDDELDAMTRTIRQNIKYPKISGYLCNENEIIKGINYFLKEKKADLLVMVTHPRKFPQNLLQKSLTKQMAYHLEVPLLALHKTP